MNRPGWFGLAAGLFILLALLANNTLLGRMMRYLPLRAVGLVSFSFYLLHPMMISCVRGASIYFFDYYPAGLALFVLSGLVTYTLAAITYTYIERPFIFQSSEKRPGNADSQKTSEQQATGDPRLLN